MKAPHTILLVVLLTLPTSVFGQEQSARPSLEQLRDQVRRLGRIDADQATPPEVREVNLGFLSAKRRQLLAVLRRRQAALEAYLNSARQSLNADEVKAVTDSAASVSAEIAQLEALIGEAPTAQPITSYQPSSVAAPARSTVSCERCEQPPRDYFVIDARAGISERTIAAGRTGRRVQKSRFGTGERVGVSVVNMNPFLYEYTVSINEAPVVETAHLAFLRQLSPLTAAVAGGGGEGGAGFAGARQASALQWSAVSVPDSCSANANSALAYLNTLGRRLENLHLTTADYMDEAVSGYRNVADTYGATRKVLYDSRVECAELCRAASGFKEVIQQYPLDVNIKRAGNQITEMQAVNVELGRRLTQYRTLYGADQGGCKPTVNGFDYMTELSAFQTAVAALLSAYSQTLTQIESAKRDNFDVLVDNIELVFKHPAQMLRQDLEVGDHAAPTDVTVTVAWRSVAPALSVKPVGAAPEVGDRTAGGGGAEARAETEMGRAALGDTPAGGSGSRAGANRPPSGPGEGSSRSAKLNFGGGAIFSLSGGIVYSPLRRQEFQSVVGFPRDAGGNLIEGQSLTNVAGFKEDSSGRIQPILMLNTRLTNYRDNNLFFSVGITAKGTDQGTNIEYLLGPSINFLDQRLFFTAGGYAGRLQKLAGDLFPGAELPGTSVPVRTETVWKPGISLTFKIK